VAPDHPALLDPTMFRDFTIFRPTRPETYGSGTRRSWARAAACGAGAGTSPPASRPRRGPTRSAPRSGTATSVFVPRGGAGDAARGVGGLGRWFDLGP